MKGNDVISLDLKLRIFSCGKLIKVSDASEGIELPCKFKFSRSDVLWNHRLSIVLMPQNSKLISRKFRKYLKISPGSWMLGFCPKLSTLKLLSMKKDSTCASTIPFLDKLRISKSWLFENTLPWMLVIKLSERSKETRLRHSVKYRVDLKVALKALNMRILGNWLQTIEGTKGVTPTSLATTTSVLPNPISWKPVMQS